MPEQHTRLRFVIEPGLLDHLSLAMYGRTDRAIAELVANAYDSDATTVNITYNRRQITIADDGIGMTTDEVQDSFLHLGRNRRTDDSSEYTSGHRALLGSKGIGKLAALGIARDVTFTTSRSGTVTAFTINYEDLTSVEMLDDYVISARVRPQADTPPGTRITLRELIQDIDFVSPRQLRSTLAREFPELNDWQVYVNHVLATSDDLPGARFSISDHVPGQGNVIGFYRVLKYPQPKIRPGFAVRVRGRIVQENSLFELDEQAAGLHALHRIFGELEPTFIDPPDRSATTPRADFAINTERSGLNSDLPEVRAFNIYAQRKLHQLAREITDARIDDLRKAAFARNPGLERRLAAISVTARYHLEFLVNSVLLRLAPHEPEGTIDAIVDLIIGYYESDIVRTLLESMRQARRKDVERLADLLAEFGAARIADIAELLKSQLEVIELLRAKVGSQALEAEIHRVIARNPWLIRERLTYWFDNREFATQLSETMAAEFAWARRHRPDLACYDDRFGPEHPTRLVVVEFKRPGVKVGAEELLQVMRYKAIFQGALPQFGADAIEIIVLGDRFDRSFDLKALSRGYTIMGYLELLERARSRYRELYDLLRAPVGVGDEERPNGTSAETRARSFSHGTDAAETETPGER